MFLCQRSSNRRRYQFGETKGHPCFDCHTHLGQFLYIQYIKPLWLKSNSRFTCKWISKVIFCLFVSIDEKSCLGPTLWTFHLWHHLSNIFLKNRAICCVFLSFLDVCMTVRIEFGGFSGSVRSPPRAVSSLLTAKSYQYSKSTFIRLQVSRHWSIPQMCFRKMGPLHNPVFDRTIVHLKN